MFEKKLATRNWVAETSFMEACHPLMSPQDWGLGGRNLALTKSVYSIT